MNEMTPDEKQEINAKLDKIIEAIYGNGKPGMVTRLALLEDWQQRCEAEKQATSKDLKSVVMPLLTQFLGGGIMLAIYVVAGHALGILH